MSMKNIKWLLGVFSMILGTVVFTACSDDEKQEAPLFPESVVLNCQPGESEPAELVFTANQPWTLASSKLWCKFSVDGELVNSLAGEVGEQTVKVVATDDVWDFNDALAELTLSMGGQTKAIAIVNRSANERDLKIYQDIEHPFGEENPAEFKYAIVGMSLKDVKIVANFDWEIQKYPEWVSIDEQYMVGKAGKTTTVTFDFNEEADIRYPFTKEDTNNRIVFVNKDGKEYSVDIPVVYEGMPEDAVQFPMAIYGWTFSQDAAQYWSSSISGEEVEKKDAPMNLQVITPSDYTMVCLSYNEESGYGLLTWPVWIDAEKDPEDARKVSITVQENIDMMTGGIGEKREGYVLALPAKIYEGLNNNEENLFIETDGFYDLKEEYVKYTLVSFTQEGKAPVEQGGFEITGLQEGDMLMKSEDADPDIYGTSNVWILSLNHNVDYSNLGVTVAGFTYSDIILPECNNLWENVTIEPWGGNQWGLSVSKRENSETTPMVITIKKYADDDAEMEHGEIVSVLLVEQY